MAREINGSDPRDGAGDRPAVRNHAGVLALVSACFGAFERHHSTWTPRLIGAGPAAIASPGIGSAAERRGAAFLGEGFHCTWTPSARKKSWTLYHDASTRPAAIVDRMSAPVNQR